MPDALYDDDDDSFDSTDEGSGDDADDPSDYDDTNDPSADSFDDSEDDAGDSDDGDDADPSNDDSDDTGSDDATDLSAVPYPPGLLNGGGDPSDSGTPNDPWAIPQVGILHPDFSQQLQAYIDRMGRVQDYLGQIYPFTNGPVDTSMSPTDRILADPYYHDDSDYTGGGAYAGSSGGGPFQQGVVTANGNIVPDWSGDGYNPLSGSGGQSLSSGGKRAAAAPYVAHDGSIGGNLLYQSRSDGAPLLQQTSAIAGPSNPAASWAHPPPPQLPIAVTPDVQSAAAQELLQRGLSPSASYADPSDDALASLANGYPVRPDQLTPEIRDRLAIQQQRSRGVSDQGEGFIKSWEQGPDGGFASDEYQAPEQIGTDRHTIGWGHNFAWRKPPKRYLGAAGGRYIRAGSSPASSNRGSSSEGSIESGSIQRTRFTDL